MTSFADKAKAGRFVIMGMLLTLALPVARASDDQKKPPCKQQTPPKITFAANPSPPSSWMGKGPRQAKTVIEITVDTNGKVHDPRVVTSGGDDADKSALEAVQKWRFDPAKCGEAAVEAKIKVSVTIRLD